jgi:hypothetical protein
MKIQTAPMAALIAIAMTCISQAATVSITSPDHGQTPADASIASRGLHWAARDQQLRAVITFSNKDYTSPATHGQDNTLAFALPGVRFDESSNVFYAVGKNGERTPVAKYTSVLFGKKIQLLPGAVVDVRENRGNISVKLVKGMPSDAAHWKEMGPNF